jgi:hypothetical protein
MPARVNCHSQVSLARAFRELRTSADGQISVLPNVFDVATARIIARHRHVRIDTTSSAMTAILGWPWALSASWPRPRPIGAISPRMSVTPSIIGAWQQSFSAVKH